MLEGSTINAAVEIGRAQTLRVVVQQAERVELGRADAVGAAEQPVGLPQQGVCRGNDRIDQAAHVVDGVNTVSDIMNPY